jgi:DNA-binding Lrp family transcriptional regulator
VERDRDLSEIEAATYYSHWIYTGITNLVAVNPRMTYEEISSRLNIPAPMIVKVMSFLIESGILIQKSGSYDLGSKRILFGPESPLVAKHHQNWRLQGFNRMPFSERKNFFFTLPMSLSAEVADQIRADLPAYIEKITGWVGPSKSEVVRCLNIDYFEY